MSEQPAEVNPSVSRRELAEELKERIGGTIGEHDTTIKTLLSIISDKMAAGERVQLRGFGTFESREIKAHKTVNPVTDKKMKVPKSYTVDFRPAKALKEQLKEQKTSK